MLYHFQTFMSLQREADQRTRNALASRCIHLSNTIQNRHMPHKTGLLLTWVTTMLHSAARSFWIQSSRINWGTCVVLPHPVAPRIMTTGFWLIASRISLSNFFTGSNSLSCKTCIRKVTLHMSTNIHIKSNYFNSKKKLPSLGKVTPSHCLDTQKILFHKIYIYTHTHI